MERFVIVVSLSSNLSVSWGTRWDYADTCRNPRVVLHRNVPVRIRLMPMIVEMRTLLPQAKLSEEVAAHD